MSSGETRSLARARDHGLVLFLVFAAVVHFLIFRFFYFEDAFITYRYAANLAAGEGFTFNPGERILGTTTPLYTILLASLGVLGLDVVVGSAVIYSVSLSACAYFGARVLAEHGASNAGVFFALAVGWGMGGVLGYFGMEIALYLALVFGAVWLAAHERPWALGLLLGAIAITRYDGVVAVGVVLLYRWSRSRRLPLREAAIAGGVLGAWLLFAQLYFGSPLPNTLGAKASDVSFAKYAKESMKWQYLQWLSPLRRLSGSYPISLAPGITTVVALFLPAAFRPTRLPRQLWVLPAIGGSLWFGYALVGPPPNHPWHLTLAAYCLFAFGLAGWSLCLPWERISKPVSAAVLVLLVLGTVLLPAGARREFRRLTESLVYTERIDSYREIATFIEDHGLARERLLSHEVGYLTYSTGQPVVDAAGLVTPGIRFHGSLQDRTPMESIVETHEPALMVLRLDSQPPAPWILEDFFPIYYARSKILFLRRNGIGLHLDRLHRSRLRDDFYSPAEPIPLHHPFALDLEDPRPPGWRVLGMAPGCVGRPLKRLQFEGERVRDRYLHSCAAVQDSGAAIWSAPFRIDFDELTFRFGGTDPELTQAQLFVGGVPVLEVRGRGPRPAPEMHRIELPVYAWRGQVGQLRFVDLDGRKNRLVADRITSEVYESLTLYDDFDSGEYGGNWERGFGGSPLSTRDLMAVHGPSVVLGAHTAGSLGMSGRQELISHPFAIHHENLSFVVFDFGGPENRVELQVDGEVVRSFSCGGTDSLVSVKWDVSELQGGKGRLVVSDWLIDADRWIGIDAIAFH